MEKMSLNKLRKEFLDFFESKDHLVVNSYSLVPKNDPSILLINAGMTPLKPYFTGAQKPPSVRMSTCQKCIRTLDIENVGKTDRHGTFFEMLGNFSFGDYFKEEAIQWGWEFFTKTLKIPEDKLYVTVYKEDDEAYDIWKNIVGLDENKIFKLGKEDNFWEHGVGPCGPCSEIFFDRGEEYGCDSENCEVGCECDRYIEVWNLVFTQFNRQEDGTYIPLATKNIDTGMGLERLACVMQGVDNLFEVDTIRKVLDAVCKKAKVEYKKDSKTDISIRIITDHIRSTIMMCSDGVLPSNEGRGYVFRRLLRRAARHGKLLGIEGNFLCDLVSIVVEESKFAYPELEEKLEYLKKVIKVEEERFQITIDQGVVILNQYIDETKKNKKNKLDGKMIFKLHDTYGFPYDLTEEIANECNLVMDKEGFDKEMQIQKDTARKAQKVEDGASAWGEEEDKELKDLASTEFVGYSELSSKSKVLYVNSNTIVLDKTPFYAESGGQSGDRGTIYNDDFNMKVKNTTKTHEGVFIHSGKITGNVKIEDTVTCRVDENNRVATCRNHSITHILQYALKEVLGEHVAQAGSAVDESRLRFDFNHFSAMTKAEVDKVEEIVNEKILNASDIVVEEMAIAKAREKGATALFGEKYGDSVRVVSIGDYSMELCGGTHLSNSAVAGLFKIVSESGVAAGVRRIEALTGSKALEYYIKREEILKKTASIVKSSKAEDIPSKISNMADEIKALKKEIDKMKKESASSNAKDIFENPIIVNGTKIIIANIEGADAKQLRELTDSAREKFDDSVILLGAGGDKVTFIGAATKLATSKGVHVGNVIREVAKIAGGGGGGRPDMAQAGGKDASKIDEALAKGKELLLAQLTK